MAVGDSALYSGQSYVGIGRETTFGTGVTASAGLNFLSSSVKMSKETQILEQIETSRTQSKRIGLGRTIEGDLEFYFGHNNTATLYILENAFGGDVTSATGTGETAGGASFEHTFAIGNLDNQTHTSLTLNTRKGDGTNGKVFEYTGLRVNEITFASEIDDALRVTTSFMGKDATVGATDLESTIGLPTQSPMSFVNGRVSVENSFASLTTSSFWHVQSFELGWSNNLKGDSEARRIGSDTVDVLPPGVVAFTFNATVRFDTTTAYDAMINETQLAAELEFLGDTLSGSILKSQFNLSMPKIFITEAGDPEIGGPDEVLQSEVSFAVLRDDSSASGYAIQGIVRNTDSAV